MREDLAAAAAEKVRSEEAALRAAGSAVHALQLKAATEATEAARTATRAAVAASAGAAQQLAGQTDELEFQTLRVGQLEHEVAGLAVAGMAATAQLEAARAQLAALQATKDADVKVQPPSPPPAPP